MANSFSDHYPLARCRVADKPTDRVRESDLPTISAGQYRLIVDLMRKHPARVQMLEVASGRRSVDHITYSAALRFTLQRDSYRDALRTGEPKATAAVRQSHRLPVLPDIFEAFIGPLSHRISFDDASYFTSWLHGDAHDLMLNRAHP